MNRTWTTVRRSLAAVAAATLAAVAIGAPALADSYRYVDMRGNAACDRETGEWVITWSLRNPYDVAGTLGNVRVYPPSRPLVAMPNRVMPGETITGTQRLAEWEHTASLTLDINWDDGPVTYNHHWPAYIKATCRKG